MLKFFTKTRKKGTDIRKAIYAYKYHKNAYVCDEYIWCKYSIMLYSVPFFHDKNTAYASEKTIKSIAILNILFFRWFLLIHLDSKAMHRIYKRKAALPLYSKWTVSYIPKTSKSHRRIPYITDNLGYQYD